MKIDVITCKGLVKWDDAKECLTKAELSKMIRNQAVIQIDPNDSPTNIHPEIIDRWFLTKVNPYRTEEFKDLWAIRTDQFKFNPVDVISHLTFMFLDEKDLESFNSYLTMAKLSQE